MENTNEAEKKTRSSSYPAVSLRQAVDSIRKLHENNGLGPYSREATAKGLGYKGLSGPSGSRIAALVYFGLLSKKGGVYSLTRLAEELLFPKEVGMERKAILKAAQMPSLYNQLLTKFDGRALPNLLNNILFQDYGINTKVANEVAEIFRSSMEFAGLLKDGILIKPLIEDETQSQEPTDEFGVKNIVATDQRHPIKHNETVKLQNPTPNDNITNHSFNFPGGICLIIPKSEAVDEAILDGALKDIRAGLKIFAETYCSKNNSTKVAEN